MCCSDPLSGAIGRLIERLTLTPAAAPQGILSLRENLDPCPSVPDAALWLAGQEEEQKFYWRSRDGELEVAALGFAEQLQGAAARERLDKPSAAQQTLSYYWISGFDLDHAGWKGYPSQLLFLPRIELRRLQGALSLGINYLPGEEERMARQLRSLSNPTPAGDQPLPRVARRDRPDLPAWHAGVSAARQQFAQGGLQKVVLARATSLEAASKIPFWSLFRQWRRSALNGYQIALQLTPTTGFMAFPPERLFRRQGNTLFTEALAGTLDIQETLAGIDAKTRHEHGLVIEDIRSRLERCHCTLEKDSTVRLLNQRNLQHLYYAFQGRLEASLPDAALLGTLHPTAAVCGLPEAAARSFIAEREPFSRGWYAGCCGPVSGEATELAINIRSARVDGNRLQLFAGAGIVPASDADLEWQELEQKIELPLALFQVSRTPQEPEPHVSHPALHS